MIAPSDEIRFGVLHCGDLGAALARLLSDSGATVVTTCDGRSPRTRQRAADCGATVLPSLDDVVSQSDILLSLVSPDTALEIAQRCAERAHLVKGRSIYIDVNSVDPEVACQIETVFSATPVDVVDATIHGVAAKLQEMGVLFISGKHSRHVVPYFERVMRVSCLGDQLGQAKRMKLVMAALSKCLNALFLEIADLAHNAGLLDRFLEECRLFYPGIMSAINRMLPTYPQHVRRRIVELGSIEQLAHGAGSSCGMISAARGLLEMKANAWNVEAESLQGIEDIVKAASNTLEEPDHEHQ